MELINTLTVKDFPWVTDWVYEFSQDTIIESNYWEGKTSLLKSITWLLTEKDLQGKSIPNIKDTTMVISRGFIELMRNNKWLNGDLNRILRWTPQQILSKIIPWYLLSSWITNKKVVEIVTWIKMDEFSLWGQTLEEQAKAIKEIKKFQWNLYQISASVRSAWSNIWSYCNTNWLHKIYDYPKLLEIQKDIIFMKWKIEILYNLAGNIDNVREVSNLYQVDSIKDWMNELKNKEDYISDFWKELFYWILLKKTAVKQLTYEKLKYIRNNILDISRIYTSTINSIENYIISALPLVTKETYLMYYYKIIQVTLSLWETITAKKKLVVDMYKTINRDLSQYWMELSWNNVLTTKVTYKWKDMELLELPRHIKTLMEINLCSRMQLDWFSWRGNQNAWLILIDDYALRWDNDSIDKIYIEALAHQVIMTRVNTKAKWITIIND